MDKQKFSSPLSLRDVQIKDAFWEKGNGAGTHRGDPVSVGSALNVSGRRCGAKLLHARVEGRRKAE